MEGGLLLAFAFHYFRSFEACDAVCACACAGSHRGSWACTTCPRTWSIRSALVIGRYLLPGAVELPTLREAVAAARRGNAD